MLLSDLRLALGAYKQIPADSYNLLKTHDATDIFTTNPAFLSELIFIN